MIPAVAVAAGAIAQWVSGIGFSLVCAPILIAVLGPLEGVRTALVLSSFLNLTLIAGRRRDLLVREGALLLVPAVAVTPLVAAAVRGVDARWLAGTAGLLTVVSAVALAAGVRWERGAGPHAAAVAGVLSGTMNVIGSIGGPAAALYAVNAGWPPARMRPTLQVVFLVSNGVALVALGLPQARHVAGPLAGLVVGWIVGWWLDPRVPHDLARRLTLAVAAVGGAVAIGRAVFGWG
ncbi:MAG TPA: sulfite exporter TauE/SafE family protein [Acidimicrobiales bacterium]